MYISLFLGELLGQCYLILVKYVFRFFPFQLHPSPQLMFTSTPGLYTCLCTLWSVSFLCPSGSVALSCNQTVQHEREDLTSRDDDSWFLLNPSCEGNAEKASPQGLTADTLWLSGNGPCRRTRPSPAFRKVPFTLCYLSSSCNSLQWKNTQLPFYWNFTNFMSFLALLLVIIKTHLP